MRKVVWMFPLLKVSDVNSQNVYSKFQNASYPIFLLGCYVSPFCYGICLHSRICQMNFQKTALLVLKIVFRGDYNKLNGLLLDTVIK